MRLGTFSTVLIPLSPGGGEAQVRERVLSAVRRYPGFGAADLGRRASTSGQLAEYHLRALIKAGLVSCQGEGRTVYFAVESGSAHPVDRRDRPLIAALRRPMALRMALVLLESGSMVMGDLAAACGVSPATATHHVHRLQRAAVVEVEDDGRTRLARLADARRLRRILIDHPPPRDVVSGFIELWDRIAT